MFTPADEIDQEASMNRRVRRLSGLAAGLVAAVLAGSLSLEPGFGHGAKRSDQMASSPAPSTGASPAAEMIAPRLVQPKMDAERGRRLFVEKGCFACHAINGVGGHDARNLDAHTMDLQMNPFEFAAKMWAMAPYMIAAQEEALGEQILFTGQELADIIAFVHDDGAQHHFSMKEIPPHMRGMMHHEHGSTPAHQQEIGHTHGADEGKEQHD